MQVPKVRLMDWQVLQVIHRWGATPQHKLADYIGRQRSTVNGAVHRLLATGWLQRVGQAGGGRGRPAILLAVNRNMGCFAGADITAEELHCAVVAADGTLLDHSSARLNSDRTGEGVLNQLDVTLRGLLSRSEYRIEQLLGVWAGINGIVDSRGVVVTCASMGWHNEPLRDRLLKRYDCDVLVQGGATIMTAAAESLMGVGRDRDSLVYYHAGRGISARFVQRGQPLAGSSQRAGELGHLVVEPNGPRCPCGNRGCLEAVASGPAILAAIRKLPRRALPEPLSRLLDKPGDATTDKLVLAAFQSSPRKGPLADLLARVTQYLSMGAAIAVAAYDPQVLVLGGYLFEENASLRTEVRKRLAKLVLDWDKRELDIVRGEVITQDRAVGGAAEVCQRFWSNPRGVLASG